MIADKNTGRCLALQTVAVQFDLTVHVLILHGFKNMSSCLIFVCSVTGGWKGPCIVKYGDNICQCNFPSL